MAVGLKKDSKEEENFLHLGLNVLLLMRKFMYTECN